MPERSEYKPGTPVWVDLTSPNTDRAAGFYEQLFDWHYERAPGDPQETGGYGMFSLRGRQVAGIAPAREGEPTTWRTYVSVADIDKVVDAVRHAGGQVLMEPLEVLDAGRMAVCADDSDAVFDLWQPGRHKGAQLIGEPGTVVWNELATRNHESAIDFYGEVFGWEARPFEPPEAADEPTMPYWIWNLEGDSIGGMLEINEGRSPETSPHWMVYFAVDDPDAVATRAKQLDGDVVVEPFDIVVGREAVLTDPFGAAFTVMKPIPL